jgi:malate dehydrogenase (oxaloacetate-decarboxylating)(NADP+)
MKDPPKCPFFLQNLGLTIKKGMACQQTRSAHVNGHPITHFFLAKGLSMIRITRDDALNYHRLNGKPGKIAVLPTKPLNNQRDLSLAYTPGVAYPVLEIEKDANLAYEYTAKGNLVAVISNGTAILGPWRSRSAGLKTGDGRKRRALSSVLPISMYLTLKSTATILSGFIQVVAAIAPTFGGINLEDIRSPECFHIERTLQAMLDIPVFHDDQHGTAIILGAALLNSLELTGRKLDEIKIVFSGGGAAGVACATHLVKIGVPREHIWMCDRYGLVHQGRVEEMFPEKDSFAQGERPATLAETMEGADVLIGLSAANIVSGEMLARMRRDPIVFAMANPDPEISYELARAARPDAIVATGRSDYPNQINNVLGFPFIFRGALDVRARSINDAMKVAASQALAALAKEPVTQEVCDAYNLDHIEFGRDYIVPKPLDSRVCLWESPAVAQAAMQTGTARIQLDLDCYRADLARRCEVQGT